ncbi:S41 family peptidase [Pseudidiomarina sp. CB1]|uniref:S41 family peptidase n=1 Tax=Pseudidiomarina sp. CB1 TaxID=2972484 RepID=UPI0021627490|nr:S41 family peptidase [Pseudidiomarina sp. CB1]
MLRQLTLFLLIGTTAFLSPTAMTDPQAPVVYPAEQIRFDLQQLYRDLQLGSYDLFAHTPKAEFDIIYHDMLRNINTPLSQLEAHKRFMRFAAVAKIAHTRIDFPVDAYKEFMMRNGKTLPIDFSVTPQRVSVAAYFDNNETSPIQVGDELIAIDGQPVDAWLASVQAYIAADNPEIMASLTEGLLVPLLWLHQGERDSYELTLRHANSETPYTFTQVTLPQEDQVAGLTNDEAPGAEEKVRDYAILDGTIGYLKPGPFYNVYATSHADIWDTEEFHRFIDEAFTTFKKQEVKQILIDVRDNPGGTNSFSDYMLAWFADKPFKFASDFRIKVSELSRASNQRRLEGNGDSNATSQQLAQLYADHQAGDIVSFPLAEAQPHGSAKSVADRQVYVLIDRYSYSNAISVAAIAQDYGFATVIGEKTGDLATTYAAMESFKLKYTGIEVGYPKAHIIRPNGDLKADGVTPDISFDFMASSLSANAKLERVLSELRQQD